MHEIPSHVARERENTNSHIDTQVQVCERILSQNQNRLSVEEWKEKHIKVYPRWIWALNGFVEKKKVYVSRKKKLFNL